MNNTFVVSVISPVFFALLCLCVFYAAAQKPFDNSVFTTVDDVRMHYRHWEKDLATARGSIVLIHGFGGSTFSWQEVADSLNQLGYEVVAVDMPPFGYSDKTHRINQSVTAHADRLHALLSQQLPGRTWHLAGHSMGGAVAQAYAICYPQHLVSVTFVAPALFSALRISDKPVRNMLRLSPLRFFFGELAEEWFIREARLERLLSSAYGVEPSHEQVLGYLYPLTVPGTARAILSAATFHEELYELDASMLSVPALAIWGTSDTWVPYASREQALLRIPEVSLVLMEDVGHNPMETHLEEFMKHWLVFLDEHSSD